MMTIHKPVSIGETITTEMVRPTAVAGAPDNLAMWQDDVHGPSAVLAAVRRVLDAHKAGQTHVETIIAADHPRRGGIIRSVIAFGVGDVDGSPCIRYCTPGGSPNGDGSSSIIPTWYGKRAVDAVEVALALVHVAARAAESYWIGA